MNPDDLIGKQGTVLAIVSKDFHPELDVTVIAYRWRFGTLDLRIKLETKEQTIQFAETLIGWMPEWKVKFED